MFIPDGQKAQASKASLRVHHIDMIEARVFL